jgi:hypothetical protein
MALPINVPARVMDDTFLSRLAYELATTLYPPEYVFSQFGITQAFFADSIANRPDFIAYYNEARAVWHSTDNAQQRFAKKAHIVLEEFLPECHRLLMDPHTNPQAKATFAQWLSKVSGADAVHNGQRAVAGEGGPTVTINIGATQLTVKTTPAPPEPATLESTAVEILPTQVNPQPATPATTPVPVAQPDNAIRWTDRTHSELVVK